MSIDKIINDLKDFPSEYNKKLIAKIKECYCNEHKQFADVINISPDYLKFSASCCCQKLADQVDRTRKQFRG